MSRGYWHFYTLFFGLILAYPVVQHSYAQTRAAEDQSKAEQNTEPSDLSSIKRSLDGIARAVETANTDRHAADGDERAKRDLEAQEEMARWAFWMFWAAAVSTVIGAAGVLLIWRTLIHTRDAAKAAKSAVAEGQIANSIARRAAAQSAIFSRESAKHARTALEDGRLQINLSDKHARLQLRAYMACAGASLEPIEYAAPGTVTATVINCGQTPALNLRMCSQSVLGVSNAKIMIGPPADCTPVDIGPQQAFALQSSTDRILGTDEIARIERGEIFVYFIASGTYDDVFGESHTIKFLYRSDGTDKLKPAAIYDEQE
ncbi:hypothetical protein [Sphingosinicella sp.]|jgi:hypothetical protein|uniref:hypothetical protein n=1 Tax=Sphingosinicella sp. TaxID=1917971 RepID=UPI00262386E9|nr:hypothetical protein [Sphingosinicella sp.]